MSRGFGLVTALVILAVIAGQVAAQEIVKPLDDDTPARPLTVLPFAFYSDDYGAAAGLAFVGGPTGPEQPKFAAGLFGGTNGSATAVFTATNLQMPGVERLFVFPQLRFDMLTEMDVFIDGNPEFPDERAGTNDSDKDDFLEEEGYNSEIALEFKYLLPIGHGRDTVFNTYQTRGGMLESGASGAESWNPFESGRTYLFVTPFYRNERIDFDAGEASIATNGISSGLERDNRDFPANPSRGCYQRVAFTRDWGGFDSSDSYTVLEGEFRKYFDLKPTEMFRQRVLALGVWTADTLTWDRTESAGGVEISHAAPYYTGPTLGGDVRMRAFPAGRFSGRSALYYAAELRLTPEWNPFQEISWLRWLDSPWFQTVAFVEAGRVADTWSLSELHSDLKWDAGVGIRAMVSKRAVLGLDIAFSDEGVSVAFNIGHPL